MYILRTLDIRQLLEKKTHFFLGPRLTGKSSLIGHSLTPDMFVIDLLVDDIYSLLLRRPSALKELIPDGTKWVVIDEIQKIPALLDEVHRLIENRQIHFLLTGSSARKLRRGGANLLGGRAWEARLNPLTSIELKEHFDLIKFLNRGGLPSVYFSDHPDDELKNYAKLYVKEEIQAEALVKRMDHFARFLDAAALTNGEELYFEGVASDSGVPARTVASYFELLEDTLLGFQVYPFLATRKRKAIKRSKFFFFDVGVAGALSKRGYVARGSVLFGKALEHFIIQELRAAISYRNADLQLSYWRSTSQFEVDAIIGTECAIEIKATERITESHMRGLRALQEENKIRRYLLVSMDPVQRNSQNIEIVPVPVFLKTLWSGELF